MGSILSRKDETDDGDILGEKRKFRVRTAPTTSRLIVKRNGHSITRKIPKPVVLVDTREQYPLSFDCFPNWIAETRKQKLDVGDYSVQGMEHLLILERKSLSDLISTLMNS